MRSLDKTSAEPEEVPWPPAQNTSAVLLGRFHRTSEHVNVKMLCLFYWHVLLHSVENSKSQSSVTKSWIQMHICQMFLMQNTLLTVTSIKVKALCYSNSKTLAWVVIHLTHQSEKRTITEPETFSHRDFSNMRKLTFVLAFVLLFLFSATEGCVFFYCFHLPAALCLHNAVH